MGGLCSGPPPKTNDTDANEQQSSKASKKPEPVKQSNKEAEKAAEAQKQEEEARRKKQLEAKYQELCQHFVDLLDADCNGYLSMEELRILYGDNADELMKAAGIAEVEKNEMNVEQVKKLFLDNEGNPDCEFVMKTTDRISEVKDRREERKAKEELRKKEKAFEDALTQFKQTVETSLNSKVSLQEVQLVYSKPVEKWYNQVFEQADCLTDALLKEAFSDGDVFETQTVIEITEAFSQIKAMRDSEEEFDKAMDAFFGELEGLNLQKLNQYFNDTAKEIMSKLDANNDGQIDRSEMKPMFRKENGFYDVEKLQKVQSGVGDAVAEEHKAELAKAKQEFGNEVDVSLLPVLTTVVPVTEEELTKIMPENAQKYMDLVKEVPSKIFVMQIFASGETYDRPALKTFIEAMKQIQQMRIDTFNERLDGFVEKLVPSWLAKLKLDQLSETCPNQADNYAEIVEKPDEITKERLAEMFVVEKVPDYQGLDTIYDAIAEIEKKAMGKFDKAVNELVQFIEQFCYVEAMGKFKRQDVFQVYIDETRVGEFDKRWVKKLLNKPVEELPKTAEMRKLFTNKKTKEPDANLVKGLLSALKTITDRRRLSIKQEALKLEAEFEKMLLRFIEIVDEEIKDETIRRSIIEGLKSSNPKVGPALLEQLDKSASGRLSLDEVKPLWILEDGKYDMADLADFTNQFIEEAKKRKQGQNVDEEEKNEEEVATATEPVKDDEKRGPVKSQSEVAVASGDGAQEAVETKKDAATESNKVDEAQEAVETKKDAATESKKVDDVTEYDEEPAEKQAVQEFDEPEK